MTTKTTSTTNDAGVPPAPPEAHQRAVGDNDSKLMRRELKAAHLIIRNALAVMTIEQKVEWGRLNARDGVDGEGVTRANEREAALRLPFTTPRVVMPTGGFV